MQGAGVSKLCIVQGSTVIRDKVKDNLQPDWKDSLKGILEGHTKEIKLN